MAETKVNPITLEVVRNGLAATANEMATVLRCQALTALGATVTVLVA